MKTNRFISLLLCVVMIMSLFTGLAGSASAADAITHEVKSGQTMIKICELYGLNYYACKDQIKQLNGFTSDAALGKLSVGQIIKLPASGSASAVATTTVATTTTAYVAPTVASGSVAYYLTAYTVQAGDTLAGICGKLNSNYYYYSPVILAVNSLANANYIRPGQVLLIPTPSAGGTGYTVVAHQVQAGETMTAICNRYGISYQAMRTLINGLNRRDNMDKIYVGQTVYVPTTGTGVASSAVVTSGTTTTTTTTTTSGAPAASAGYTITFATGGAFASANGKDYVSSAPAGVEVSVWSNVKAGYAVKSVEVIRTDTGALVPVDYNYFTMPNSNVYVDVAFEKGLTITKTKAQGGSFETSVGGFLSDAAFAGDLVTVLTYPNQYYSVKSVSYQKTDGTVSAVDVKKDASGNYSFTMPSYPIKLSVSFAPTQYHTLSYSGTIGNGKVTFTVNKKEVKQAEQGETVTLKFVPDTNWAFNTSDFENNLVAHIPNRSSMGSFKKIDDTTYTFVMGTKDINVVGAQFLNRSYYTVMPSYWANQAGIYNGVVYFNVIDQATGTVSYAVNQAKFGDTVQVVYYPNQDFVADTQYSKDNSKGAGNALLSWNSDTTFTMPDSNVTVNARFIQDGSKHYYTGLGMVTVPSNSGSVEFIVNGCACATAEIGKVVTVKVNPKPNFDVSVAKIVGTEKIYAVSLNGYLPGEAPAAFNFIQVDPYTYTFVKGTGFDQIRVAFASDYQGVNATFTQITEGGTPVVQGIKGFAVNGNYVSGDVQVISGDTVSFSIELLEGYEITQVRKYVRDKSVPTELAGTTTIIPGGKNNSYSYTVTNDDISAANSVAPNGELVFEITARKNPETYYTVKYTTPKIDGKTPTFVGTTTPCSYDLRAEQISVVNVIRDWDKADIAGISGNLVEGNDVLVSFKLSKTDVFIEDTTTLQKMYYTFDKLLINGEEYASVDSSSDPANHVASFILPKDVADGIVTTEVVYKLYKTEDAEAITLKDLQFAANPVSLTSGTYDYTVNVAVTPQNITGTYSATPDSAEIWLNDVLLYTDTTGDTTLESTSAPWVTGPNTLVIKLHKSDQTDTTYTFTVNYAMDPAILKELKVTDSVDTKNVSIHDGDPGLSTGVVTGYEVSVIGYPTSLGLDKDTTDVVTYILNGVTKISDNAGMSQSGVDGWPEWKAGANTLELIVKDPGGKKSPTRYIFTVNVALETSTLKELTLAGVNGGVNFLVPGQYEYAFTVTTSSNLLETFVNNASDVDIVNLNGTDVATGAGDHSVTLNWDNLIGANTIQITVTESGKAPATYLIRITPNLEPSAMDIYLEADGNLVKFVNLNANYSTTKSTCKFDIKLNATTDEVTMSVNGTEYNPLTGALTVTAEVKGGEKVEKWNVGNNVVTFKVVEKDSKETVYTLNVNYQATPLMLKTLTRSGVVQSLSTYQSWTATTAMTADQVTASADIGTVNIRVDGDTATLGTRIINWSTYSVGTHYIDIEVTGTDYTTGTYHIDVNLTNP